MKLFGISTEENLPDTFFYSHKKWDEYMAHLWYNFLVYYNLSDNDTIIEVGPGYSIKIAAALAKMNFAGRIYLVDPFQEVLQNVKKLYSSLLPNAQIYLISTKLADSGSLLPKQPTFVLANHPLDDMILGAKQTPEKLRELFNWTSIDYEQTTSISHQVWFSLAKNISELSDIKENIFEEWRSILEMLQPEFTIISQYASSTLKNAGLNELNTHAKEILTKLQQFYVTQLEPEKNIQTLLNANKNYNDQHIGSEVLNAKNWLVKSGVKC